jgi:hypothetical protein
MVVFAVFGSSSWLIDVTDGYVVSIGVHLAFTHPCYASSGSLIHSSVSRGTMYVMGALQGIILSFFLCPAAQGPLHDAQTV